MGTPESPATAEGVVHVDVLDGEGAAGLAIRGAALRTGGHALGVLGSLLAVPFMIRYLGVVDYGYFITVSSIMVVIQGITEAGLTNLGVREFAVLQGDARDALLRNLLGLRVTLTLVGVAVFTAGIAITGAEPVVVAGTLISGIALLFAVTQQSASVALTGTLRLGWVSALELVRQLSLSAVILLLIALQAGLIAFFWANVLACLLMATATFVLLRHERSLRPAFHGATWKALLRETLPFAFAATAGVIYLRVAVILMSYVASDVQTGLYSAALRIMDVTTMVPQLLVASTFPILARAARDDLPRLRYGLQRQFEVAMVAGAGMGLAIAVVAPFAIAVVAGKDFVGSVPVLRILAGGLVTGFIVGTTLMALLALKRYREILVCNALGIVVAVVGALVLTPTHGAMGGAVSTVAAEGSVALVSLALLARDPMTRLQLGVVPKVAVAVGAALVPVVLIPGHPLVLTALALGTYVGVALALGAVPAAALAAMRRRT